MPDRDPFDLPPEREVTPELRARVLQHALSTDTAVRRRRRWATPLVTGLAAAAVVFGVLVVFTQGGADKPVGPAGHDNLGETHAKVIGDHPFYNVDDIALPQKVKPAAMDSCRAASPPRGGAGHILTNRRLFGPDDPVGALVYDNRDTGESYRRYFCSPWGVVATQRDDALTSLESPIAPIEGTRVQGLLDPADGSNSEIYYDAMWFANISSVESIEARIVVDGVPGTWYRTKRFSEYSFVSVWTKLAPSQLTGDIEVEYRAINTDRELVEVPGMTSMTVSPADVGRLSIQVDFPRLDP
jgi:hypothetical protein